MMSSCGSLTLSSTFYFLVKWVWLFCLSNKTPENDIIAVGVFRFYSRVKDSDWGWYRGTRKNCTLSSQSIHAFYSQITGITHFQLLSTITLFITNLHTIWMGIQFWDLITSFMYVPVCTEKAFSCWCRKIKRIQSELNKPKKERQGKSKELYFFTSFIDLSYYSNTLSSLKAQKKTNINIRNTPPPFTLLQLLKVISALSKATTIVQSLEMLIIIFLPR